VTPGGLGVIEVTTAVITVSFGAPRATAVLAVLGYRIVNYWLPLLPGAVAYLRLRLQGSHRPTCERPRRRGLADNCRPYLPEIHINYRPYLPEIHIFRTDRGFYPEARASRGCHA
jgi:hypothetical protein